MDEQWINKQNEYSKMNSNLTIKMLNFGRR